MTNTVASVYTGLTGNITNAFDGLLGIAIAILTVSIVFALVKGMTPHRVRVK